MPLFLLIGTAPETQSRYNPRETFAPFDPGQAADRLSLRDGRPGPQYWQNRADYSIARGSIRRRTPSRGTVEIRYTNNSPGALDVLWLQLEQNLYRAGLARQ